jgi:hypothetical protein
MVQIGEDMGAEGAGTLHWVVEKISEAYMTTDSQGWADITLVERPVPSEQKGE